MTFTHTVNGVDLDQLFETIDHIAGDPQLARFRFRARNQWIDGAHSRTTIEAFQGAGRKASTRRVSFVLDADDPPVMLGGHRAPNAPEYLLHALAACLTGTIAYHAAVRGISIEGMECSIEGDLDLRGFLGLDESVRPGYENIRAIVTVSGDVEEERLLELGSLARHSPVRDVVSRRVPITIDVERA